MTTLTEAQKELDEIGIEHDRLAALVTARAAELKRITTQIDDASSVVHPADLVNWLSEREVTAHLLAVAQRDFDACDKGPWRAANSTLQGIQINVAHARGRISQKQHDLLSMQRRQAEAESAYDQATAVVDINTRALVVLQAELAELIGADSPQPEPAKRRFSLGRAAN